jgi:lipoprotein-releasing system permease protein
MLAKRYLNPRRAVLSSFTLISLMGVMLGVLVLVVVMAVYAGLERDVKGRLLGFTPHILVVLPPPMVDKDGKEQGMSWRDVAEDAKKVKGVAGATAYVADNVIVDVGTWQKPVSFRGIDTGDAVQVDGITKMLDMEKHPESTADMGLDDRVVISSVIASQFQIGVGDMIRLYSTRNFESVMDAYKKTEKPVVREAYAAEWESVKKAVETEWQTEEGKYVVSGEVLDAAYSGLEKVYREEFIRDAEKELVEGVLVAMQENELDEQKNVFSFSEENWESLRKAYGELAATDAEKMDGEALKGLKDIVLPKEALVVGVYAASQMAVTPDIFMPLPLAQGLAGLDDEVQGISLRLDDPYKAEEVVVLARKELAPRLYMETWGEQYQAFFMLINQQRMMMYFALSFIVLVSAFSMMAVMFTVTIQKRREIGVMKALGAAPGQIVRVFLYQGMLLGLLGALLGVGLGRLVIHFRGGVQEAMRALGFDPFSAQLTGFGVLPAYNDPLEQAVIAFMAFVLCSIAALVPAFFAAQSDAAKSLRNL